MSPRWVKFIHATIVAVIRCSFQQNVLSPSPTWTSTAAVASPTTPLIIRMPSSVAHRRQRRPCRPRQAVNTSRVSEHATPGHCLERQSFPYSNPLFGIRSKIKPHTSPCHLTHDLCSSKYTTIIYASWEKSKTPSIAPSARAWLELGPRSMR